MEAWIYWVHGLLLLSYTISRIVYPWVTLALASKVASRSDADVTVKLKGRSVELTVHPRTCEMKHKGRLTK